MNYIKQGCCCTDESHEKREDRFHKRHGRVILSSILLLGGIAMNFLMPELFHRGHFSLFWYIAAYIPVGAPVLIQGYKKVLEKDFFSEFTLMTIATIGAFYIGEYPEGVAVMLFYSIGESFQGMAIDKAKRNISALLDVRCETVSVIREGKPTTVSPKEVEVGEIIEVKSGERVSLDGVMQSKKAAFNTSALTGESRTRRIDTGEEVLAGMISTDSVIRIRVTKPYDQSALAGILELVQNASARKSKSELFIRKFAHVYTPIVTGLAILIVLIPYLCSFALTGFGFVFDDWLYRALVFLVISCPCALVISIPLGYFGGIGTASRLGILFKGGNYLDAIANINTVVFDKTGTLTKGVFKVQSIEHTSEVSKERLMEIIASVEAKSTHPIAKAITDYAQKHNIDPFSLSNVREISGCGLKAEIGKEIVLVGNAKLLSTYKIPFPQQIESETDTDTVIICALAGRYIGHLLLADSIKEDAVKAIEELKSLKIENIEILSGDKQSIVTDLANKLGIKRAYGDLLPQDKVRRIEQIKQNHENRVAFVGDGMNDAPVLALSDIGVAMGGLGSDVAIETADIVIQSDHPSKVATAILVGKQTKKIVWQNIALAFGVKLAVLILGAGGLATLWEAVFADVGVALLAILNAMRIQRMIK